VEAPIGDEPELVYFFMHRVNGESAYKRAVEALDIDVNRGEKAYPATVDAAYAWLEQVPVKAQFAPIRLDVGEQLAYLSERVDKITAKNKDKDKASKKKSRAGEEESDDEANTQDWWKDAECFGCGETGHIKVNCPKKKSSTKGTAKKKEKGGDDKKKKNVTAAFTLVEDDDDDDGERVNCIATKRVMSAAPGTASGRRRHKSRDVVFDGGSETNLIGGGGKYLLRNIRPMKKPLIISGVTDGSRVVTLCGDLVNGLGTVPYDPKSHVNIIALSECDDSPLLNVRLVQRGPGVPATKFVLETPTNVYEFPRKKGLYVCPGHVFAKEHGDKDREVLMTTTADREKLYTKREVEAARKAERIAERLMFPSKRELARILPTITNAPVTVHDVVRANHISPTMSIARSKGMSVHKKPPVVKVETLDLMPELQRDLVMEVDVFFVGEKDAFLISRTLPLGLLMVEPLGDGRSTKQLQKSVMAMVDAYRARGFNIKSIQTDNEGGIVVACDATY